VRQPTFSAQATLKAALFTSFFALGVAGVLAEGRGTASSLLPYGVLLGFILLNSFFSIRIFASITSEGDRAQSTIDATLVLLYLAVLFATGEPLRFAVSVLLMFVAATAKYVLLRRTSPHRHLLRHKITVDVFGFLAAGFAAVGIVLGHEDLSLCLWAVAFSLAQLDIFVFRPLYVFHPDDRR
jgi:hypothetical protein